jgi:hypothetical protein
MNTEPKVAPPPGVHRYDPFAIVCVHLGVGALAWYIALLIIAAFAAPEVTRNLLKSWIHLGPFRLPCASVAAGALGGAVMIPAFLYLLAATQTSVVTDEWLVFCGIGQRIRLRMSSITDFYWRRDSVGIRWPFVTADGKEVSLSTYALQRPVIEHLRKHVTRSEFGRTETARCGLLGFCRATPRVPI